MTVAVVDTIIVVTSLFAAAGDDAVLVTGDRLLQRHAPPGRAAVDSASAFLERIERRP